MCHHNRAGRRRGPAVVALGALAYKAYQDRKSLRSSSSSSDEKRSQRSSSPLGGNIPFNPEPATEASFMIVNSDYEYVKSMPMNVSPPRYDSVFGSSSRAVEGQRKEVKHEDSESYLSDAESFYDVVDGMRYESAEVEEAKKSFVQKWKASRLDKKKAAAAN